MAGCFNTTKVNERKGKVLARNSHGPIVFSERNLRTRYSKTDVEELVPIHLVTFLMDS